MAHKLTTFTILVRAADHTYDKPHFVREPVRGYVVGDYGCHKARYTWNYTHIPTGLGVTSLNARCHETKGPALATLEQAATLINDIEREELERATKEGVK